MKFRNVRAAGLLTLAALVCSLALVAFSCSRRSGSGEAENADGTGALIDARTQAEKDAQAALDALAAQEAAAQAAADALAQAGGDMDAGATEGSSSGDSDSSSPAVALDSAQLAALEVYTPRFGTKPGLYAQAVSVSLSAQPAQALIMYTVDGSIPSPTRGKRYEGPFTLSASAVVKAMSYVPKGKSSSVSSAEYTVGELCVAPGGKGDGTLSKPMGNIGSALAKAQSLGVGLVKLAEGSFSETVELDAPISLSGGWKSGFLQRGTGFTRLSGKEPDQATSKMAPAYALRVSGARVGGSVSLSKLYLTGPEATYSAGLVLRDGAAPQVQNCESRAGFSSYGYGALVLAGASPSFVSCTLHGGEGATSFGLSVDGSKALVRSCFLLAGTGTVSGCGLSATDASVAAYSSVLAGGKANLGYGAALYNSKGSRFEFCTLVGGFGKEATACFVSEGNPAINACVIASYGTGKSFGIVANYGQSSPSSLRNTVFLSCSSGLYYDADTKLAYTSAEASGTLTGNGQALSEPKAQGCLLASFSLGPDPRYESPAGAMAGVAAGAADAQTDVRGKARSGAWTPGAYQ